jgi:hypothetical protein
MRWQAVIVLLAIVAGAIVPPSFSLTVGHGDQAIGTLDLCHSGTPAISSNGDMPCVNECECRPLPLSQYRTFIIPTPRCKPFLIAYQDERPPKI